ncbi:MAG: tRNA-binding protein [Gemmatimonadota bacterium]|nr:tRNA-binding protein [Gemmatimonadota bacterium]MDH5805165.1 tRNA-binding protein [Gemmatimonadota bacterium]
MPTFQEFQEFDIRVGTVVSAKVHPSAKKPAIQLEIDFGDLGVKKSSAQITVHYSADSLIGRQVAAVVNFPPRRVADFESEVLVLGAMVTAEEVVLLNLDQPVANGTKIG